MPERVLIFQGQTRDRNGLTPEERFEQTKKKMRRDHPPPVIRVIVHNPPEPRPPDPAQRPSQPMRGGKLREDNN